MCTETPLYIVTHQSPASSARSFSHTTEITTFRDSWDCHKTFKKRSRKLRNTHFRKMCIVHSLVLWKAGREGGHYAVRSSMEHRWPEGAFTMQGVEREGSWAAGVQLKCGTCQPTWLSLRMCLGQWWVNNMLHMGGGLSKKTSFRTFRGLWVKAEKWRAAKLRKRRRGRGAENAEPKERKGC